MTVLTSNLSIAVLAFLAVMLLVLGTGRLLLDLRDHHKLRSALALPADANRAARPATHNLQAARRLHAVLQSLSRLSVPEEGWQSDKIRLRFLQAGFDQRHAARNYYAIKSILTIIAPLLIGLVYALAAPGVRLTTLLTLSLSVAVIGYYLPEFYLYRRTNARVEEMRVVLPDVIDLLVICTESGLGLDQALGRVAHEIARSSPMVAGEFHLANLEIRAGAGRATALRNLALRVKLDDLSGLAAMLIQADRFGTGVAVALRIQSETMRAQRMQRAEEAAAKVPTKMLLPLVFCIFPVLMIVILGPAIIRLMTVFADSPPQ